jgi:hypothetical protein
LADALELGFIDSIYDICKILNSVHFTTVCTARILDYFEGETHPNYIKLVILLIVQQLNHFENEQDMLSEDAMAFPLAFQLLKRSGDDSVTRELQKWVRIVSDHYKEDVVLVYRDKHLPETVLSKIFDQLCDSGVNISSSKAKRLSFPDFEMQPLPADANASQGNYDSLMKLVCYGMKIIVVAYGELEYCLNGFLEFYKAESVILSELMNQFYALLDGPNKIRNYSDAFIVTQHMVRIQAKANGKMVVVPPNIVSTINKRALRQILSQKEPNYSGNDDIYL